MSETSLSSDCEMKGEAASGNPTKVQTNTDSQPHNSRKRKVSEFSCNPGMQKHELFLLLLLTSTLLYLKGRSTIFRVFKGTFSYRTLYRFCSYYRRVLLRTVKLI